MVPQHSRHFGIGHFCLRSSLVGHLRPPPAAGRRIDLRLNLKPRPQVAEQADHSDHWLASQSTVPLASAAWGKKHYKMCSYISAVLIFALWVLFGSPTCHINQDSPTMAAVGEVDPLYVSVQCFNYLRHLGTLHFFLFSSFLGHAFPPFSACCFIILLLYWNALPHVAEHSEYSVHGVTIQSTAGALLPAREHKILVTSAMRSVHQSSTES